MHLVKELRETVSYAKLLPILAKTEYEQIRNLIITPRKDGHIKLTIWVADLDTLEWLKDTYTVDEVKKTVNDFYIVKLVV